MKQSIFLPVLLFLSTFLSAQEWHIMDTEIDVHRGDASLALIFRNSDTLTFNADTAFLDQSGIVFIQGGGKIGLVEPWDFFLIREMNILSIEQVYEFFLVKDHHGMYFVSDLEFFEVITEVYDAILPLTDKEIPGAEFLPYLVKKKGKYGLIELIQNGPDVLILSPVYDEVVYHCIGDNDFRYRVRSGKKWGMGSVEGLLVGAKYDHVEQLFSACNSSLFRIWKKGLCGLYIESYQKEIIPPKYTRVEALQTYEKEYIFLYEGDEMTSFYTFDGYMLEEERKPIAIVEVRQIQRVYLLYETSFGVESIEMNMSDVVNLDLEVNIHL